MVGRTKHSLYPNCDAKQVEPRWRPARCFSRNISKTTVHVNTIRNLVKGSLATFKNDVSQVLFAHKLRGTNIFLLV